MSACRKWGALGGLVVVWALLIAFRLVTHSDPQQVPLVYQSGRALAKNDAAATGKFPAVMHPQQSSSGVLFREPKNIFAALHLQNQVNQSTGTRLFKKIEAPIPIVPPPASPSLSPPPLPVVAPPLPTPEELAAQEALRQKEFAAQQARQQLAQYRFLGYLTQNGEQRTFLGKEKNIYIARHGETLEGQILVKSIEDGFIQLMDVATRIEQKIALMTESGAALLAQ